MKTFAILFLHILILYLTTCHGHGDTTLDSRYPFSLTLSEGSYYLYWNVSFSDETIQFAVRVKTTGWVGFGISPNGQMPGSDVIIGWVDGDNAYFHDRYAEQRSTPPIDKSQDWFLVSSRIHDGYTELEFTRNFTTCDTNNKDLPIGADTARVVYSWNDVKPTVTRGADGTNSYSIQQHQMQGSASVNLLGGQPNPPTVPSNAETFTVEVSNLLIPSDDTTYWCKGVAMSSIIPDAANSEKYIIKHSPKITPHASEYVHHMLVYACNGLLQSDLQGEGSRCYQNQRFEDCTSNSGILVAAWAVGGDDFVYPENVAYPIAGPDSFQYFVIETHYNNPSMVSGVLDSSGITFTYINERREHHAGTLVIGHQVSFNQVIPPRASNYSVKAFCSSKCSEAFFPTGGINVFANTLHTHLAGTGVALSVVRSTGNGEYKEIRPIEKNLKYDFNFQQTTNLPKEIQVLPGDYLVLNCYYNTTNRSEVTFGGQSTTDEMCLSFPIYYPKVDMTNCLSRPVFDEITGFVLNNVPIDQIPLWQKLATDFSADTVAEAVNELDWDDSSVEAVEKAIYVDGTQFSFCVSDSANVIFQESSEKVPEISQYYSPPAPVRSCVEGDQGSGAATVQAVSAIMLLFFSVMSYFLSF